MSATEEKSSVFLAVLELFCTILAKIHDAPDGLNPASDFHDRNTYDHLIAVEAAAMQMGQTDAQNPKEADKLLMAARLHDLGKLRVWDPEKKTFHKHEKASADIIRASGIDVPADVTAVVEHHGWIRNVTSASDKGFKKFLRKLYLESGATTFEEQAKVTELYYRLQVADAAGFSPEGSTQRMFEAKKFLDKALGTKDTPGLIESL